MSDFVQNYLTMAARGIGNMFPKARYCRRTTVSRHAQWSYITDETYRSDTMAQAIKTSFSATAMVDHFPQQDLVHTSGENHR